MTDIERFPLGTRIGILGGGQLGRMLALAAARLGMRTHIYCPDPDSPAFEVTPHKTVAAYEDETALARFAEEVDIITYEFENVPVATARFLEGLKPLAPGTHPLAVSQDRIAEKGFLTAAGIAVAPYRTVENREDLTAALDELGLPAVLKTSRMGYDGKGQRMLRSNGDAAHAFQALSGVLVLEAFIPFDKEISVVVARNASGDVKAFEPAENVHVDHILKTSTVPAAIPAALVQSATRIAGEIVTALDYVGVLGVEFFVVPDDGGTVLLVNEIAPRVHNSGHWTEAGCITDQFEQHIRAILNWPLGDPTRQLDVVMENLIGDEIHQVPDLMQPGLRSHVYGKVEARPGRKMGHVNRTAPKTTPK